jgi:hypothetical protein
MDVHPTKNVSIGIDPYPYETWQMFKQQKHYFPDMSFAIDEEPFDLEDVDIVSYMVAFSICHC